MLHMRSPSWTPSIFFFFWFFLHVSVIDIDQLKLIMMLVGTPGPELLVKISSDSVSVKSPIHLSAVASDAALCCSGSSWGTCVDATILLCISERLFLNLPLNSNLWFPRLSCTFYYFRGAFCPLLLTAGLHFKVSSPTNSQSKVTLFWNSGSCLHPCLFTLAPCPTPHPTTHSYTLLLFRFVT